MSRASRLHRVLEPGGPLFEIVTDTDSFNDDRITSVQVVRGSNTEIAGLSPSTLEFRVTGRVNTRLTGQTARLRLPRATWEPLLSRLGITVPIATIEQRFRGRTGPLRFDDSGKTHRTTTSVQCGSWIGYEDRTGRTRWFAAGTRVYDVLAGVLGNLNDRYAFGMIGDIGNSGAVLEGATFGSVWSSLAADVQLPVRVLRSGTVQAVALPELEAETVTRTVTAPHLLRSQTLEPAEWTQPNEVSAATYDVSIMQATGNPRTQRFNNAAGVPHDYQLEEIDWTALHPEGDHWVKAVEAFMARRSTRRWVLTSLRVSLPHLMTSTKAFDRQVAGFLLSLEEGQSINIAGDWPPEVQGAYIVCGISESITPDGWQMELSLLPFVWVFGSPSPPVYAHTWDAAIPEWDQTPATWEEPV